MKIIPYEVICPYCGGVGQVYNWNNKLIFNCGCKDKYDQYEKAQNKFDFLEKKLKKT